MLSSCSWRHDKRLYVKKQKHKISITHLSILCWNWTKALIVIDVLYFVSLLSISIVIMLFQCYNLMCQIREVLSWDATTRSGDYEVTWPTVLSLKVLYRVYSSKINSPTGQLTYCLNNSRSWSLCILPQLCLMTVPQNMWRIEDPSIRKIRCIYSCGSSSNECLIAFSNSNQIQIWGHDLVPRIALHF